MFTDIIEFTTWVESQKRITPKTSLEKMIKLCQIIGNPHEKLKFIHVGGTNGKGSTVSYLKNILRSAGLNVGTFISPYVVCFNERIGYNEQYITDEELLYFGNLLLTYYPEIEKQGLEKPTFFEVLTLIGFIFFASKEELDVVILEVGLGGLLDSTNIITPLVSIITNVSFDHMNVLGNTLEEIAENKLGICKPNVPLFTTYDPKLESLFTTYTKNNNTPLYMVNPNKISNCKVTLHETTFDYQELKNIKLQLLGYHQAQNSILSIEVSRYLRKYFPITNQDILTGLYQSKWPGRIEVINHEPLMIIDGAHNQGGVDALVRFIKDLETDKKIRIIFAVSHDKEKNTMIKQLEAVCHEIVFTEYHYKRSDQAENLFNFSTHPQKKLIYNINDFVDELIVNNDQMMNIFCGSLYFASEVRSLILNKQKG